MLGIAGFGVTCELEDPDEEIFSVSIDHFSMTQQEAEAAGLITPEEDIPKERPARGFRARGFRYVSLNDLPPRARRKIIRQSRRRNRRKKRTAYSMAEFADLSDGRRVIVRSDRGFSESWKHSPSPFHGMTQKNFADDIRYWFVQYEEDDPTPPEWIAERLQRLYGIEINLASIYDAMRVPLRVEFGPRLLEQLPP